MINLDDVWTDEPCLFQSSSFNAGKRNDEWSNAFSEVYNKSEVANRFGQI